MKLPLVACAALLCGCATSGPPAPGPAQPSPLLPAPVLRYHYAPPAPPAQDQPDPPRDASLGLSVHGLFFDDYEGDGGGLDGDVDVEGWGAQLDFFGPRTAFALGAEDREYEDDTDSTELFGAARFFLIQDRVRPYLEGRIRYGLGLEPSGSGDSEEFWGWGAGGGLFVGLSRHLYLDAGLRYESTFDDIELDGGAELELEGWIGSLGVGIAF